MQTLFEKHLAENYAISAFALYSACSQFRNSKSEASGILLQQALLVPAMVFHQKTAASFATRMRTEGLFYRILSENVELTVGLQERVEDVATRTLAAIHFGCSARILYLERSPEFRVCSAIIAKPQGVFGPKAPDQVKQILKAADRLGYCFATTDFAVMCAALRISF
jgi:hypothetical protein